MFDDPDGVIDPVWGDLCQDSSILTHPKNEDGLKNVSPTYSITPSSSSLFHTKLIPEQMLSGSPGPKTLSNHNRDTNYDGCSSAGTAKGFNCPSNNVSMGEKTTDEFYNSSNMLDCKDSFSLEESYSFSNGGIMEYDSKYGDNQDSSFLDCDWASMTNFDDLDGIFSNYSVLGDRTMGKGGEILSPTDSISTKITPALVPDITVKDVAGEKCSYPFQGSEGCQGKAIVENVKMVDKAKMDEEKGHHPSQLSYNNAWINDMDDTKMGYNHSAMLSQQGQVGESKFVDYQPPDQQKPGQYDFAVPSLSPHHVAKKQRLHDPGGYVADYTCDSKNISPLPNSGEILSTVPTMTPLQKIGKLRWHQQMQATLAIKQQQKQLDLQFSGAELDVPRGALQMNHSTSAWSTINSEEIGRNVQLPKIKVPVANEVDGISLMGLSQAESALYQLQDAISKLDDNFRACIRDSLFRLARNAIERCNGCDRSSTNTCSRDDDEVSMNAEAASQDRLSSVAGEETETNLIDRVVARMLFNCSSSPFNGPQPSSGLVENEPSLTPIVSMLPDGGNSSHGSARR